MRMLLSVGILMALQTITQAHEAPSGWKYATSCCSNQDCREIPASAIKETANGYVIKATGEVLSYNDHRLRDSPDGVYHWCSSMGSETGHTICLYRPPQGY